jgi:hypothetical protein
VRDRRDLLPTEAVTSTTPDLTGGGANQDAAQRLVQLWSSGSLDDDAFNDGSRSSPLGQGDQVFDANGEVIAAFPATPDGVVQAALYELHRGERRSMAEILADNSLARLERGPNAAAEVGKNRDSTSSQVIGRRNGRQMRPIAAYMAAAGLTGAYEWCGGFCSFVYARAGIDIGSLAGTLNIDDEAAQDSDTINGRAINGEYYRVNGSRRRGGGGRWYYEGGLQRGLPSNRSPRYENAPARSARDIDVRPGDCFWLEYPGKQGGHAGVIVGTEHGDGFVNLVTIEGNYGQKLKSNVRRIETDARGGLSSTVKGWARPAELSCFSPPERERTPRWVRTKVLNGRPDEDTTSIIASDYDAPEESTS